MNTKRGMGLILVGAIAVAVPVAAQAVPRQQRAVLVRDVEQAFLTQVSREMALTEDQAPRFQRVVALWAQKRGGLEADERKLRQALNGELRPGVAANPDSVSRLVDAINVNRIAYADTFRDEMHDLTPVLTPVQRGLFQLSRDRLLTRVRDLQQQRPGGLKAGAAQEP